MGRKIEAQKQMMTPRTRLEYAPPKVVTYQEDEILKQMGHVGGCTSHYDGAPMNPFGYPRRRHPGRRNRRYRSSLYRDVYDEYDEEEDI
jgi:hypothetical protein